MATDWRTTWELAEAVAKTLAVEAHAENRFPTDVSATIYDLVVSWPDVKETLALKQVMLMPQFATMPNYKLQESFVSAYTRSYKKLFPAVKKVFAGKCWITKLKHSPKDTAAAIAVMVFDQTVPTVKQAQKVYASLCESPDKPVWWSEAEAIANHIEACL